MSSAPEVFAFHGKEFALNAEGLLRDFNRAGILSAADVHVARRLGVMSGEDDDAVLLAVALVVRSTRQGSVVLDLETAPTTTSYDEDEAGLADDRGLESVVGSSVVGSSVVGSLVGVSPVGTVAGRVSDRPPLAPGQATTPFQRLPEQLPWPDSWAERCTASPLVGGPLRMVGSRIWLARYWQQEEQVAAQLLERSATLPGDLDLDQVKAGLQRLFPRTEDADQREAAAVCAVSRISVLAGGPGTGKTTTVARLLALLREQHPTWRIALAAPTGKAAARLEEAVRSSSALLPAEDRARLGDLSATTLHRLLGWRPDARSRFRHNGGNRLPREVVVVDESSMVSLTMMARLLEALRPSTRLVMVGDPDQLASVEAGAVLGDLVDRATLGRRTPEFARVLRQLLPGADIPQQPQSAGTSFRNGVTALSTSRRFSPVGEIAALAAAIQNGSAEAALAVLQSGSTEVEFVEVEDDARLTERQLSGVRIDVQACGAELHSAAARGDRRAALAALEQHRLLCAHRQGPRGVQYWSALAAAWIAEQHLVIPRADGRYAGEPLLVTTNDYEAELYNGDTGVVVDDEDAGLIAVFGRGGAPIPVTLARLGAVRSLHAMTVHRSQGSQFDRITVLLPVAGSPLGTRETLYTAVTRGRQHVRVIGSTAGFTRAVLRPAARATGLRERLHG